jgi:hypothetical protein
MHQGWQILVKPEISAASAAATSSANSKRASRCYRYVRRKPYTANIHAAASEGRHVHACAAGCLDSPAIKWPAGPHLRQLATLCTDLIAFSCDFAARGCHSREPGFWHRQEETIAELSLRRVGGRASGPMKVDVQSRSGRSLIDGGLTLPDQASAAPRRLSNQRAAGIMMGDIIQDGL